MFLVRVRLELLLVKLSHKKRKESASPVVQVSLGTSEVPVNPSEENPPSKAQLSASPASHSACLALLGWGGSRPTAFLSGWVVGVMQGRFMIVYTGREGGRREREGGG